MKSSTGRSGAKRRQGMLLLPPSQLVAMNLRLIEATSLLVVGAPMDDTDLLLAAHLPDSRRVFFNFDYATHKALSGRRGQTSSEPDNLLFGSWYRGSQEHDSALIYLPKSRRFTELTLTMTANAVKSGGRIILVGENDAGIRSSRSILEDIAGPVETSEAARHSVLYLARNERKNATRTALDDWVQTYQIDLPGQALSICSLPGVFSHGRLDAGTRLLLEHLDLPRKARVLDFGCGAGVIGGWIKKSYPDIQVDMIDTSALALESARRTMAANGLPVDGIWASDGFSDVSESYTHIVSNPPFHVGIKTDYHVVEDFLKSAKSHLTGDGSLLIVANRFLKYRPLLDRYVGKCEVAAENSSYRVYRSSASKH
jgi:16S rRNA (guanine1207-N2)-methyltransferase